jgi:hypothetical protein
MFWFLVLRLISLQRPAPTILMDRNRKLNFPVIWRVNKEDEREPDREILLSIKRPGRGGRILRLYNGDGPMVPGCGRGPQALRPCPKFKKCGAANVYT